MYLSIYRSNSFESNCAKKDFQYGTYLPHVCPDVQDLSPRLNQLWKMVSEDHKHDLSEPRHQAYTDWRQIRVYDIGKKSLHVMGHSEFFNRFDVPNLADDIDMWQQFRGRLPKKLDDRRNTLSNFVRSMFCLNENDIDAIATRYLAPGPEGFVTDAQALMERVIDTKIQGMLTRLAYRCVPHLS